jgi:hypothetical protein
MPPIPWVVGSPGGTCRTRVQTDFSHVDILVELQRNETDDFACRLPPGAAPTRSGCHQRGQDPRLCLVFSALDQVVDFLAMMDWKDAKIGANAACGMS